MNRTSNVNIDLGQRCLALIRDIADRGASSSDPDFIGYSIQELRQVLSKTGNADEVRFLPVPPCEIHDLPHLIEELLFVDCSSRDMFGQH